MSDLIIPLLTLIGVVVGVVLATSRWKVNPFIALLVGTILMGLLSGLGSKNTLILMQEGFGRILGSIGLVVALGCILGVVLERTGAIFRIAALIIKIFGKRAPHAGMGLLGAIVGIPVFCDSGYVILSRLNKPIAFKTGHSLPAIAMSLAAGLYITHTLVPPTPGPLAVAGNFGLESHLGWMIILGVLVGIPAIIMVSFILNLLFKSEPIISDTDEWEEGKELGIISALAPVLVPVVLIALGNAGSYFLLDGLFYEVLILFGNPVIALMVGVFLSLNLVRRDQRSQIKGWIEKGIKQAAPILLLTGIGGAFGYVISHTSLVTGLGESLSLQNLHPILILLSGFILTMLLKSAQGSSTSALVIGSAIIYPFAIQAGFEQPIDLIFLTLSLGAGSMVVSHANDSFFWVVTQFSGFNVKQGYQYFTVTTAISGLLVMVLVVLCFLVWGLVGA